MPSRTDSPSPGRSRTPEAVQSLDGTSESQASRAAAVESAKYDHQINLFDKTKASPSEQQEVPEAELSKRSTHASLGLRKEITNRKFKKWGQDRTNTGNGLEDTGAGSDQDHVSQDDGPVDDASWGVSHTRSRLNRGKQRIQSMLNTTKAANFTQKEDEAIDILYENQRGTFWLGKPRFSSRSLLNFDPAPWLNVRFEDSAVDIRNAQVPDPSWEWSWKSWFVDMSDDVDEEGWQYSFAFQKGTNWHGTHPWFHSFVRRRRWVRKRVRKHTHRHEKDTQNCGQKDAHAFNSDYFTIHNIAPSITSSIATSQLPSAPGVSKHGWDNTPQSPGDMEISDMPTLMKRLRSAAIDREKIVAVQSFLDTGGEELHYLAEYMSAIMSLLVFQNSRRQLLALLMNKFDAATEHRDEHVARDEPEDDVEKRAIDNLLKAVEAADAQCKRLEYWSDVKDMVKEGETLAGEKSNGGHEWGHGWATGTPESSAQRSREGEEVEPTIRKNIKVDPEPEAAKQEMKKETQKEKTPLKDGPISPEDVAASPSIDVTQEGTESGMEKEDTTLSVPYDPGNVFSEDETPENTPNTLGKGKARAE